jgi:creatinine amidohydrolase
MEKPYLLERMTWPEAQEAFERTSVVVIPTGSTEQHGPHMPLGTDFLTAAELSKRLAERTEVIVTPTIPIGYAKYHTDFYGTLSVSEDTLTNALIEICDDLLKYGATHIIFVNGHGGNLDSIRRCGEALREVNVPVAVATYWNLTKVVNPEWMPIGHADYIEASLVMAVDESIVHLERSEIPEVKNLTDAIELDSPHEARFEGGDLLVNLVTADFTDSGDMLEFNLTSGDDYDTPPSAASKEIGDTLMDGIADYLVRFVEEFKTVELPPFSELGPVSR